LLSSRLSVNEPNSLIIDVPSPPPVEVGFPHHTARMSPPQGQETERTTVETRSNPTLDSPASVSGTQTPPLQADGLVLVPLAAIAAPIPRALHPDIGLLAQPGRNLVQPHYPASHPQGIVQKCQGTRRPDRAFRPTVQYPLSALCLDRYSGVDPGKDQTTLSIYFRDTTLVSNFVLVGNYDLMTVYIAFLDRVIYQICQILKS